MFMLRGADLHGLDRLRIEVANAAAVLAGVRRRLPAPVATPVGPRIADVEAWLRRQEVDLRLRRVVLDEPDITLLRPELRSMGAVLQEAGKLAAAGGVVVLAMGVELDRYSEATAELITQAGHQVAHQAGPFGPTVEEGATVAARTLVAWGDGAVRTAEVEASALAVAGNALERTGRRLLRALPG